MWLEKITVCTALFNDGPPVAVRGFFCHEKKEESFVPQLQEGVTRKE